MAHPSRAALVDDLGGKIHFVVRRADAWAELNDEIFRTALEFPLHRGDRMSDDPKLRALSSGVNEAEGPAHRVDKVHSTAIGHIDREAKSGAIRDQTVRAGRHRVIDAADNGDFRTMDLLRASERVRSRTEGAAQIFVVRGEPGKGGFAIDCHVEARDSPDKGVANPGNGV